jgi:hypothetical protein
MNADSSGLDLLGLFVNNFDVGVIYDLGWYAAKEWMAAISGIILAIAIAIRSFEEKITLASGGETDYQKFFTTTMLVAIAMGAYFVVAWMVINFFNSIYGMIDTSDSVQRMTQQLDGVISKLLAKEYEFSFSDVIDSAYAVFATVTYAITFCMLILAILLMRIAHALLVSYCIFWGAAVLPMSVTTGLKQLAPWRMLCILALTWPIVDALFMYLISGSFSVMLEKGGLNIDNVTSWSMGTLVFYMAAFSIINLILVATTLSAPFVAQGMANGTGNVTGMIGSFGAAAIAAGTIAGKGMAEKSNFLGGLVGDKSAEKGMAGLKSAWNTQAFEPINPSNDTSNTGGADSLSGMDSNYGNLNTNLGSGFNMSSDPFSGDSNPSTSQHTSNNINNNQSTESVDTQTPDNGLNDNENTTQDSINNPPNSDINSLQVSSNQDLDIAPDHDMQSETHSSSSNSAIDSKKAQSTRGAIINNYRKR